MPVSGWGKGKEDRVVPTPAGQSRIFLPDETTTAAAATDFPLIVFAVDRRDVIDLVEALRLLARRRAVAFSVEAKSRHGRRSGGWVCK